MNGFKELSAIEQFGVCGGKDTDVAKLMEMLGYGIGMIVKMIKDIRKGRPNTGQAFSTVCLM